MANYIIEVMGNRKHNNGVLEFRDEECKRLFQSALYKYTEEEYFECFCGFIVSTCNNLGFYPTPNEIKCSATSVMKTLTESISEPEHVIEKLGPTWGSIILSIWMTEIDLDDPEEKGLSILATILRELDYLKEKLIKL